MRKNKVNGKALAQWAADGMNLAEGHYKALIQKMAEAVLSSGKTGWRNFSKALAEAADATEDPDSITQSLVCEVIEAHCRRYHPTVVA
ncbi:hypothetical protein [Candidatus Magnetobacterium casense]|uniref:Uncharacterized protein n=1 Tax=Candidatus Magnetobacterium casense TaxID=1455061 RepID=A0ABS6S3S5_9BACT|nr:hypothetical protein [Candidatus Magnetobacterium casensis]MBV6343486.1 hypothetical protein [Candidatus Magnetobacterium casensis]